MYKTHQVRTTFGSSDVEKVHAVVARSTFRSENVKNTPAQDHFWKLRCRKSARRCGAKHISKSKCTKHTRSGPLLEVQMSKKCTPLWREAHFQVKMYKTHHVRTIFGDSDVEKVHAGVARSTFPSQNVQNTPCTYHFWRFRCTKREGFVAFSTTTTTTLHYTTLQYITLHYNYNYNYTFTTFYYLHHTTLHYTTFHYTTSHYTTLHYTTLHYITLQLQLHNYTPLHSTTLHRYTKLRYTTLHYTTRHSTTLHYTTLHYTTLPSTTLHYITLHYTQLHYNYNYNYTPLHSTTLHYTRLH